MDNSNTFAVDMSQSYNIDHDTAKSRSSSKILEHKIQKKMSDIQDSSQLGEETQSSTYSPHLDSNNYEGALSCQFDNYLSIKNSSMEKETKNIVQLNEQQCIDQGAYLVADIDINEEISKMDSVHEMTHFNRSSHHEMLITKSVSQRAPRKQSETSHFQSRLQDIPQNSIVENTTQSGALHAQGRTSNEGPHLEKIVNNVVSQNERQDQASVVFGNSIFSMPVDFSENDVNKEVNNPLEEMQMIAVQTHSSKNQQLDEIQDDFDYQVALGKEVSQLTDSPKKIRSYVSDIQSIEDSSKRVQKKIGISIKKVDSIDQKVIKLADQLAIPSIEEHIFEGSSSIQYSLGATPIPRQSGDLPSMDQMMMPPTRTHQRKRFNSSMHDMVHNGQKRIGDQQFDGQSSNLSTNISYISDNENHFQAFRTNDQKRREHQVLDRIQKIWTDMAIMKKEIQQSQIEGQDSLKLEAHMSSTQQIQKQGKVNISAQLGFEMKSGVGPLFRIHQETQMNAAISNIEKELQTKIQNGIQDHPSDNRVKAIGDMILAEMGFQMMPQVAQQQTLELLPQYSSDFISYQNLQKEIDEQCLRPNFVGQTKVDEVAGILQDFGSHNQSQQENASH